MTDKLVRGAKNTDRELWREPDQGAGDYYSDSIFVTDGGAVGINCGGHVIVLPLREWHRRAHAPAPAGEGEGLRDALAPSGATDWEEVLNGCDKGGCERINSGIDPCIERLVEVLNAAGFETVASCCGHGNTIGSVALNGGKELLIAPDYKTARRIERMFPDIHGVAPAFVSVQSVVDEIEDTPWSGNLADKKDLLDRVRFLPANNGEEGIVNAAREYFHCWSRGTGVPLAKKNLLKILADDAEARAALSQTGGKD